MRILRSPRVWATGGRLAGYTVTGTGRVAARPPSSRAVTETVTSPGATGAMVKSESARLAAATAPSLDVALRVRTPPSGSRKRPARFKVAESPSTLKTCAGSPAPRARP